MRVLYDAGSLINLANGQVLERILESAHHQAFVAPLVHDECPTIVAALTGLIDRGHLTLLPDAPVTPGQFAELLDQHGLGIGETECIAYLAATDFVVSCDDAAARRVLTRLYGRTRVTGTLGLLLLCASKGEIALETAFASYQQMRALGGYLPTLSSQEFAALLA